MNDMATKADTDVTASQAAGTTSAGQGEHDHATHDRQFDSRDARVSNFDQDTGTDERYEVETADRSSAWFANGKRTYDLHQTLDTDELLYTRKRRAIADADEAQHKAALRSLELRQAEHTLERAKAEAEQTRRHYEDMHSLRFFSGAGFMADTVQEAFADRVADRVCAKMKGGA